MVNKHPAKPGVRPKPHLPMEDWQMIYFKACPKCRGELYQDRDAYGHFRKCLQCGRIFESQPQQPTMSKPEPGKLAA